MRLIDADKTKNFFFSETSGIDEVIQRLIDKHNLNYANNVNEDEVISLCYDLLEGVQNVIDTEPTAFDIDKVVKQLEEYPHGEYVNVETMSEIIRIVKAGGQRMKEQEAIKMAKAKLKCLENRISGRYELCDRNCVDCDINYMQGNMGEQKEWLSMLIKALEEQEKHR